MTMPKTPAGETFPLSVTFELNVFHVIPSLFTSKMANTAPHVFIAPDGKMQLEIQPREPSGAVMRIAMAGTIVST